MESQLQFVEKIPIIETILDKDLLARLYRSDCFQKSFLLLIDTNRCINWIFFMPGKVRLLS